MTTTSPYPHGALADGDAAPPSPPPQWGDTSAQGVLQALARRWWVVVLCLLACGGAAAAVGLTRSPTYSATSSLNVGKVDVRVQALSSFVTGASSLAASYSRIATSETIVAPVARDLGTTPGDVEARLSATSVPSSSLFDITGEGASREEAIELTNAAVKRMRRYVNQRSSDDAEARRLLKAYAAQAKETATLKRRFERLSARRESALAGDAVTGATNTQSVPSSAAVTAAEVAYQTAELQAQSLSGQYQARSADNAGSANVELLNRAFTASSDRDKMLQQLLAAGIVGGFMIGAALALLIDRRSTRRRRLAV